MIVDICGEENMEEKIIELINAIKDSYTGNNIVLICTVVSCLIALISLIISIYLGFLQFKDRLVKKRVLGYIYRYYAPTYIVTNLPTTSQIENELGNIFFSKQDIFDTLIELNKENMIEAVSDLNTDLPNVKWKTHMIFAK